MLALLFLELDSPCLLMQPPFFTSESDTSQSSFELSACPCSNSPGFERYRPPGDWPNICRPLSRPSEFPEPKKPLIIHGGAGRNVLHLYIAINLSGIRDFNNFQVGSKTSKLKFSTKVKLKIFFLDIIHLHVREYFVLDISGCLLAIPHMFGYSVGVHPMEVIFEIHNNEKDVAGKE